MTALRFFAFVMSLALLAPLAVTARAQAARLSTVNVTSDGRRVRVSAQGDVTELRTEVLDESGEVVFDSGAVYDSALVWGLTDSHGKRVDAGSYTLTVSYRTAAGKLRKRVEQVWVAGETAGGPEAAVGAQSPSGPAPYAVATITGEGAVGKIAKFTGANAVGNSVMTENTARIGINVSPPMARLHVFGATPAAVAGNGTHAFPLLQATGGRGGDTTVGGSRRAGNGASISLAAGNGGNAVEGSINGYGGSIILQPGLAGTGPGIEGLNGSVVLAADGGNVGVGTNTPTSKLYVLGSTAYAINAFNTAAGGIAIGGSINQGEGVHGGAGTGYGVYGRAGLGDGVHGFSGEGNGVYGTAGRGYAGFFEGKAKVTRNLEVDGAQSFGSVTRQMVNLYGDVYGIGVQSFTFYQRTLGGFAWYRGGTHNNSPNNPGGGTTLMRLDSAGNLVVTGRATATDFVNSSDRRLKTNFSAVNPRSVLDRLARVPVQTWSYKTDPSSVRHMGPVAQDFKAAFGVGADDKHISTVDADGVALASIQALYQLMQEKDAEIKEMRARLQGQQQQLNRVQRAVSRARGFRRR